MLYTALLVAASATLASAQVVYNSTTGIFTCTDLPNGDYCAGDSLVTNIIIRCVNGTGQPGNCDDNLDGYFPVGDGGAVCYQSSTTAGDAACAKNCIVEGGSGNSPTFTLPNCTPSSLPSSSASASSTSSETTTTSGSSSTSTSTTVTSTGTSTFVSQGTTITETFTTTYCPEATITPLSTLSTITSIPIPLSTGGTTSFCNGTITQSVQTQSSGTTISSVQTESSGTTISSAQTQSGGISTSATKTPVGPTTTAATTSSFTGAAMANNAGLGLVGAGLFIAYLL